jgi:hypothetical protein
MALDTLDVFTLDSSLHKQAVLNLEHNFSSNEAYVLFSKRVVRLNDASEDAILLRYDASMSSLRGDGVKYICRGGSSVFVFSFC